MNPETTRTPTVTLNLTSLPCPTPLLEVKRRLDRLAPGEVLVLISSCPGTRDDLFAWIRRSGDEILAVEPAPGGAQAFHLRKGHQSVPEADVVLDLRGVDCPGIVLAADQLVHTLAVGQVLKVISGCSADRDELSTWARYHGLERLAERRLEPGVWEAHFVLRRPVAPKHRTAAG